MRLNAQQATEVIGNAPRLICTAGPVLGQEFPVGQGVYIGRDGNQIADWSFLDPQVSGQHLWIGMINGRFVARDNGSTNGTFLNGQSQRVTEVELKDNDVLTLGGQGSVKFAFQDNTDPRIPGTPPQSFDQNSWFLTSYFALKTMDTKYARGPFVSTCSLLHEFESHLISKLLLTPVNQLHAAFTSGF